MAKLFLMMGKSASGKDTLYHDIVEHFAGSLRTVVPYTTRPQRVGEEEGVTYHFVSEEAMRDMEAEGRIIECRCYQTVHGPWYYFTADDGQIDLAQASSILIVTPEACGRLQDYFGKDNVIPLYVWVDDGVRLERALKRERKEAKPRYEELCRRFLADASDFSEEVLSGLGIAKRYENDNYERVLSELCDRIAADL